MRVKTISIQGAPVEMDEAPASRQSDGVKSVSVGTWHTSCFEPSGQSCREKLEFIFVVEVDGLRGPNSDELHLLKAKLICKFYSRENVKYRDKGFSLGAIKLRCLMGGVSKISGVTFADLEHTETLELESESSDFASSFREITLAGDGAAEDAPRGFLSARKPLKVVQANGFESPVPRSATAPGEAGTDTPHTAVKKLLGLDTDSDTPEWRKQPQTSSPHEVALAESGMLPISSNSGKELASLREEEDEDLAESPDRKLQGRAVGVQGLEDVCKADLFAADTTSPSVAR
jgi:hypothetical protein